jgi:hypothetical protein
MAGGEISNLFVTIGSNVKPLFGGLRSAQSMISGWASNAVKSLNSKLGSGMGGVFQSFAGNLLASMTVAGAQAGSRFVSMFAQSVSKASDLNETLSKTRVLLGRSADEAINLANMLEKKGVASAKDVLDSYTNTYLALVNQGVPLKKAVELAGQLEQRMADIASQRNIDPKKLREVVASAQAGEFQTLRQISVFTGADDLKNKRGAGTAGGPAMGQAVIEELLAQTEGAAGDFEATMYSMANMARANEVKWEAGLTGIGQFFQEAGQAFEFLKSTVLDALLTSLGDGKLQEAGNNIYLGLMDLASVFMEFGPQMASDLGGMITFVTDVFRGVTQAIKMAFVDPLNLVKAGIAGFGIAILDAYKYISSFVGGSGLPIDEWKKSLEDMRINAESGMVDNIIARGDSGFAEKMREKFQAGSGQTGPAANQIQQPQRQMEKDVKSSRSSLTGLLSDVVGSKDEKLVSINEAQLSALQVIAGAVSVKGAEKVAGSSLNTISSAMDAARNKVNAMAVGGI